MYWKKYPTGTEELILFQGGFSIDVLKYGKFWEAGFLVSRNSGGGYQLIKKCKDKEKLKKFVEKWINKEMEA
jgi:hypothetical protein